MEKSKEETFKVKVDLNETMLVLLDKVNALFSEEQKQVIKSEAGQGILKNIAKLMSVRFLSEIELQLMASDKFREML